jgi:hypothetical protein
VAYQLIFPGIVGSLCLRQSLAKKVQTLGLQPDPCPVLGFLSCLDYLFKLFDKRQLNLRMSRNPLHDTYWQVSCQTGGIETRWCFSTFSTLYYTRVLALLGLFPLIQGV